MQANECFHSYKADISIGTHTFDTVNQVYFILFDKQTFIKIMFNSANINWIKNTSFNIHTHHKTCPKPTKKSHLRIAL